MAEKFAIVGDGAWAPALVELGRQTGAEVLSSESLAGVQQCSVADALRAATLVFLAVPSTGLQAAAERIGPHISGEHVVIHCGAGLAGGRLPSQQLRAELASRLLGTLGGPADPDAVCAGLAQGGVVASAFPEVTARAVSALKGPRFRLYVSPDLVGVELATALSAVVALADGVLAGPQSGLSSSPGLRALLLSRGMAEMRRLGVAAGARAETFAGLAGLGRLLLLAQGQGGPPRALGEALAAGGDREALLGRIAYREVRATVRAAVELGQELGVELPIARGLAAMLAGRIGAGALADQLMSRAARKESD